MMEADDGPKCYERRVKCELGAAKSDLISRGLYILANPLRTMALEVPVSTDPQSNKSCSRLSLYNSVPCT